MLVLVVVTGLLLMGGFAAVRYGGLPGDIRAARDAAQRLSAQAQAIAPADLDRATVEGLRAELEDFERHMEPLRDVVAGDPIVAVVRGLPEVGVQVDAADALVGAADALVEAGQLGLGLADGLVALREADAADPSFAMMPGLVALMATSSDEVDRIGELIADAERQLETIPSEAMGQIREARDLVAGPLTTYRPLLDQYREVDDVLAGLLGWQNEARYLVLAQNPAELRPAGGYAGTIGVVGFRDGALVEQRFQDVYDLDLKPDLPFIEPPPELASHLLGDDQSWRLADAAWSADFPTSAQKAREFYELQSGDGDIDGVIAITTYALDRLLEVVGPVTVDEFGVTVEPGDVTLTLLGETRGTATSIEGRKDILDALARTVVQRLLSLPPEQWVPMLEALEDIGREKMALAWLQDASAQRLVSDGGWAGEVADGAGDYIYALESNVAPTSKYNLVVDRSASLVVELDEEGDALDSLRLDWQNDAAEPGEPYRSIREYSVDQDGWYGAYLRLLVPDRSELVASNGDAGGPVRGSDLLPAEGGRGVFGNYLLMPPGASFLSYLWTVPGAAQETEDGWEYRLSLQKQPGARTEVWSIRVELPTGAEVLELPDGAVADGDRVTFETTLSEDVELLIRYTLPSGAG